MPMKPGNFAWHELMTSDSEAAAAFYHAVIGWDVSSFGGGPYSIFSIGPANVGGMMPIPEDACAAGVMPCWTGYILVDDVDAYVERVKAAGGKVLRAPEDIPGVLRFAVVADPQGAAFILYKGMVSTPPVELAGNAPGNVGWHELHADNGTAAFDFYAGLFGWTKSQAIDMGPMGIYQTFAAGGPAVGGMMTRVPETPRPFWLYYFNVDAIDAAAERVTQHGGQVIMGPVEVPTELWIVNCIDPQGAFFALLAPKR